MMLDNNIIDFEPEKSLDAWVIYIIAPINTVIYEVIKQINKVLSDLANRAR